METCANIDELFDTIVNQLENNNIDTPFYKGPLSQQTLDDLDNVIRLNKMKFWTIDSQTTNPDNDGKIQRAYISGFVPSYLVYPYAQELSRNNLIVGVYQQNSSSMLVEKGKIREWNDKDLIVSYKKIGLNLSPYKHIYAYGTEIDSFDSKMFMNNYTEISVVRENFYDTSSLFAECADIMEKLNNYVE